LEAHTFPNYNIAILPIPGYKRLGVDLRGGIEAEKLSVRTKVVGRIHFAKPKNSHEVNTVLYAGSSVFFL
jgi:hypothetical protein